MQKDFISNIFWTVGVIIASALLIWGIAAFSANRSTKSVLNEYKSENQKGTTNTATTTPLTPPVTTNTSASNNSNTSSSMNTTAPTAENPRVRINTTKGPITVELFPKDAPKTVNNFLSLIGDKFYDGIIFHRVIKGFMIQGGDPTGTGTGGPGYKFEDELNPATESYKRGYVKGTLAMANAGPNTNGSQFFIMLENVPLPNDYTIFGRVVDGQNVVDAIGDVATDPSDKPLTPVKMEKVEVVK